MRALFSIFFLAAAFCHAGADLPSEWVFKDLDNISRRPLDPADKIASVLIFFWQDCPISNSYAPELNRIAASHTHFAFYIVQVYLNLLRTLPGSTRGNSTCERQSCSIRSIVL